MGIRETAYPWGDETPPAAATTDWASGLGGRFLPEPARSRSRRVSSIRRANDEHGRGREGARYRGGVCLGSFVGDRRRRLFELTLRPTFPESARPPIADAKFAGPSVRNWIKFCRQ